jgi:predicted phage baseplate assembly protein
MACEEPKIDDRTFEQIVNDLRLRIPRYAKEWTNHNDSDPGMTLLQLFAWLSEQMQFRMNQVPRKNYIKFLKLLGEDLEPATPATAHLTFVTKKNAAAAPVPARAQVAAQLDDSGEPLIFETERGLDLISPPLDTVGLFDGAKFLDATSANETPGTKFKPFGPVPVAGNAVYLGFVPPDPLPKGRAFPQTMTTTPPIAPVTLVWEYRPAEGEPWERLNVLEDETAAFTGEGYVRVDGPASIEPYVEVRLKDEARYWIRVRLDSGRDYPAGRAPEIDFLRPNTVAAKHLSTVRGEIVGSSEAHPSEEFTTRHKPVVSLELEVHLPTGEKEPWTKVHDFLASKPEDRHYRLDATGGVIQFGDGDRGRIPGAGARIVAIEYRYGGGRRGNEAGAGMISSPRSALVGVEKVTNERPAVGGADEQSLQEILLEGPSLLRRRSRAVTPEDFKGVVEEIGGIRHAIALPLFHPDHPGVKVPGALTVVAVPDNEDRPPKPSGELIAAICEQLDKVRLLTTEVFVKGPSYQEVRIEARVNANPYAAFDTVSRNVLAALDELLDPRNGAFGKDFSTVSIYAAILKVRDVTGVRTLNVYVDGRRHEGRDDIAVPADGLLYSGPHIITVQAQTDR